MYYSYSPFMGWPSPWGPPMRMGYPMDGPWAYPYGGMPQMPYYPPPGGYGAPGMSSPYGQPDYPPPGGYGAPGMSPYGQPDYPPPGGYGAPGMSSPYGQPMAPEQEINYLRDQAQMLKQQMDQIEERIKELEKRA
jgi:hypothetical protein